MIFKSIDKKNGNPFLHRRAYLTAFGFFGLIMVIKVRIFRPNLAIRVLRVWSLTAGLSGGEVMTRDIDSSRKVLSMMKLMGRWPPVASKTTVVSIGSDTSADMTSISTQLKKVLN